MVEIVEALSNKMLTIGAESMYMYMYVAYTNTYMCTHTHTHVCS